MLKADKYCKVVLSLFNKVLKKKLTSSSRKVPRSPGIDPHFFLTLPKIKFHVILFQKLKFHSICTHCGKCLAWTSEHFALSIFEIYVMIASLTIIVLLWFGVSHRLQQCSPLPDW